MTSIHQTAGARIGLAGLALLLGLGVLTSCGDDDKGGGGADSSAAGGGQDSAEQEGGSGEGAGTGKGDGKGDKGDEADQADDEGAGDSSAGDGSGDSDGTGSSGDAGGDGEDGDGPATADDPNSPFVVAAAAVGTRSRDTVVTLHALGLSTTSDRGVPHELLPDQGKKLRGALREQVLDASRLTPPKGSAAARLVTSLSAYSRAAGRLAKWTPRSGPLPKVWFQRLGAADKAWLKALRDLSDAAGEDLLEDLPELLMPSA